MAQIDKIVKNSRDEDKNISDWNQVECDLHVQLPVSSKIWIRKFGLKKKGLLLQNIVSALGTNNTDKSQKTSKKLASSVPDTNIIQRSIKIEGTTYKISCRQEKFDHFERKLQEAVILYKKRIEWLTTGSRRTFGVIEEKSVTVVLVYSSLTTQQFNQLMTTLESVLRQQVSQISKFNLIRASEDMQLFSPECVHVSRESLEQAVRWLWNLDHMTPLPQSAALEAVFKALSDKQNEAVYLYTEGTSVNLDKELLEHKCKEVYSDKNLPPLHVVSFNCDSSDTVKFLRSLADATNGRFHAYAVMMDLDIYETHPVNGDSRNSQVLVKSKTVNGVPPGAGVRMDVILIFEELEEARHILEQLAYIQEKVSPRPIEAPGKMKSAEQGRQDQCQVQGNLSSKDWLKSYGLEALGLGWYDTVSVLAFRHTDTVVDLMYPPCESDKRDAVVEQKLVNARYCDELFPVVKLKNGEVYHILVTTDIYRSYELKVQEALQRIQQRIDWLNKGSRAMFGTLLEEQVCLLLDISESMQTSFKFVKQQIFILMQEQLRHKKKFNIIAFNSLAYPWKSQLVEVSESTLRIAWTWIQSLRCSGSTNTSAAIQLALTDASVQAIYLLTDGRPDQPGSSITEEVARHKSIPIHTISFNCNDSEANFFLYHLAEVTGGRYHHFSTTSSTTEDQPKSWESMDIKDLKAEITQGLKNLNELLKLKEECSKLMLKNRMNDHRKTNRIMETRDSISSFTERQTNRQHISRISARNILAQSSERSSASNLSQARTYATSNKSQARSSSLSSRVSQQRSGRDVVLQPVSLGGLPWRSQPATKLLTASSLGEGGRNAVTYLTRTNSGRFTPSAWMLPESKLLFQKQECKQKLIEEKKDTSFRKLSIKQWLDKHGLTANHLTIGDAIGQCLVSHKAKYIPVLKEHVYGKVFDEILPMAFVTKSNETFYFDLKGVDLLEYDKKVEAALKKIKRYLDKVIRKALPSSAHKDRGTVSCESEPEAVLQMLKDADLPVAEKDILALFAEIAKGEKYIKQSQALRQAEDSINAGGQIKDLNQTSPDSSRPSSRTSRSSLTSVSSNPSSQRSQTNMESLPRTSHLEIENNDSKSEKVSLEDLTSLERSPLAMSAQQNLLNSAHSTPAENLTSYQLGAELPSEIDSQTSFMKRTSKVKLKTKSVVFSLHSNGYYSAKFKKQKKKNIDLEQKTTRQNLIKKEKRTSLKTSSESMIKNTLGNINNIHHKNKHVQVLKQILGTGVKENKILKKYTEESAAFISQDGEERIHNKQPRKVKVKVKLLAMKGQKVIARRADGFYYSGRVSHCPNSKQCVVQFGQDEHPVATKQVLPLCGAISCPPLFVGDPVLVRVIQLTSLQECFVPAVVASPPQRFADCKLYTAILYNGHKVKTKRRCLMKISKEQFENDCSYILSHQQVINEHKESRLDEVYQGSQSSSSRSSTSDSSSPRSSVSLQSITSSKATESSVSSKNAQSRVNSRSPQSPTSSRRSTRSSSPSSVSSDQPSVSSRSSSSSEDDLPSDQEENVSPTGSKKATSSIMENDKNTKDSAEPQTKAGSNQASASLWLFKQRMSLQKKKPLSIGQLVLAKWPNDGRYYTGIILNYLNNCSYQVKDTHGFVENIWREDILPGKTESQTKLQVGDKVLAHHSACFGSYAPGTVLHTDDDRVNLKFYDNQESSVERGQVQKLSPYKYRLDVENLNHKQNELVQKSVVARNDEAGVYLPGRVVTRHGNNNEYEILWVSEKRSVQKHEHIFWAASRRPNLHIHKHVLACSDPVLHVFLPGVVLEPRGEITAVQFCDGSRQELVLQNECFWLTENYYLEAVEFYKSRAPYG